MKNKLILASTSPYRQALLSRLGLEFEALKPACDEDQLKTNFLKMKGALTSTVAQDLAEYLSLEKAKSVLNQLANSVCVIGGDQLLFFENQILGKPGSFEKAREVLLKLQNHRHLLITSVCVLKNSEKPVVFSNITELSMKPLTSEQIEKYLQLDQPYDCAGSYKIEKHGVGLFHQIKTNDFTAIEGLPLLQLSHILESFNFKGFQK